MRYRKSLLALLHRWGQYDQLALLHLYWLHYRKIRLGQCFLLGQSFLYSRLRQLVPLHQCWLQILPYL